MRNLDDWQDPVAIKDLEVISRGVGQFKVRANSDDLYHVLPSREKALLQYISKHLRERDFFVDAGANIGFYSVYAGKLVGEAGRVVAIEMMPDTATILRHHIFTNRLENIEVIERALADRDGEWVKAVVTEGKFGQASISRSSGNGLFERECEVETTTLDALFQSLDREVAILKMDLEGAEYVALLGGSTFLRHVRAIIFEENSSDRRPREFLAALGFAIRRLDGNNFVAEASR